MSLFYWQFLALIGILGPIDMVHDGDVAGIGETIGISIMLSPFWLIPLATAIRYRVELTATELVWYRHIWRRPLRIRVEDIERVYVRPVRWIGPGGELASRRRTRKSGFTGTRTGWAMFGRSSRSLACSTAFSAPACP